MSDYNAIKKLHETVRAGVPDHYIETINNKPVLDIQFQVGGTAATERNGVFIEDLLIVAYAKLNAFNKQLPSRENSIALTKIEEAIMWLHNRKTERELRGVYGAENK